VPESGIRERAGELVRLREELKRTYAARDGREKADQAWALATKRLEKAIRAFYAPFTGLGRAIRAGERDAVDSAVRFLEADPWCFRSGYVKAELMSALANAPLGDDDKRRLHGVVLNRLKRREPRLLRPAGRLAANVWDDDLSREIDRLVANGTEGKRADADAVRHAVEHKKRSIAGGGVESQ
jgi:hypothetical protein